MYAPPFVEWYQLYLTTDYRVVYIPINYLRFQIRLETAYGTFSTVFGADHSGFVSKVPRISMSMAFAAMTNIRQQVYVRRRIRSPG